MPLVFFLYQKMIVVVVVVFDDDGSHREPRVPNQRSSPSSPGCVLSERQQQSRSIDPHRRQAELSATPAKMVISPNTGGVLLA